MAQATIKLRVKTIKEDTFELELNENATVDDLKSQISETKGYEVGRQRLIFRGKVLKSGQTLQDYSIKNGDTLHLIVRKEATRAPRNDEPNPEQMASSSTSQGSQASARTISLQMFSSSADNVLQSVLSNFNPSGSSPLNAAAAARSGAAAPPANVVPSIGGSSVFDLRRLLNPSDPDTATNDESTDDAADASDAPDAPDGRSRPQRKERIRERRRVRQRKQQAERAKEAENSGNDGANGSNNNNNNNNTSSNANNSQVSQASQGTQAGRGNPLLSALSGQVEIDQGQGFSPVGLIPPVLRSCRAMHLEIDRLHKNYVSKALGRGGADESKENNESNERKENAPDSAANGVNGSNGSNGAVAATMASAANTSGANGANGGTENVAVDVSIAAVSVETGDEMNMDDILNEFANQTMNQTNSDTNNNNININDNDNNNNNSSTNAANGSNGNASNVSVASGTNPMAAIGNLMSQSMGLNGNASGANANVNANANGSVTASSANANLAPRRHRREYLRHLLDVFERTEDIMEGRIEVEEKSDNADDAESERKDGNESGLTHEFSQNATGVMGFVSYTLNELMRYQSYLKREFKKLENENKNNNDNNDTATTGNNNNNNNASQRPNYQESDEMKQRREELQNMTKHSGEMLIEIGTVLASLGHVMTKGVSLDPSNYDSRGRVRVSPDQSAHVIRTAVPVGFATSLSLDASNPNFGSLLRSIVGAAGNLAGGINNQIPQPSQPSQPQQQPQASAASAAPASAPDASESKENKENEANQANEQSGGGADVLGDVLANFDIDAQPEPPVTTQPARPARPAQPAQRQHPQRRQQQVSTRQQPQAPAQQQQQQQQQPNFGSLLSNVMNMMSGSGGAGGNGGGNDGLAGLMRAFGAGGAGGANAEPQRQPAVIASRVVAFVMGLVGMNELSSARQGNWDFLKYLRKQCQSFVLNKVLEGVDTPMRRNEVCKELSVGLGKIMTGRLSNDRRQELYSVAIVVFGGHLHELLNGVLDSVDDADFGRRVHSWGRKVLSEFVYKLGLNFANRDVGVKQYLTHLVRSCMGSFGAASLSVGQVQLVGDFVGYFVDAGRQYHLKTLQTQRSQRSQSGRVGQNEQWAMQLNDDGDRQRWLDTIRRDSQRMTMFVNEMRNHRFSDAYQGRISEAVLERQRQKRESKQSKANKE